MSIGEIRKALTPIVVGGMTWATFVVNSSSKPITGNEWLYGASLLVTALGVYTVTNAPPKAAPTVTLGLGGTAMRDVTFKGNVVAPPADPPAPAAG